MASMAARMFFCRCGRMMRRVVVTGSLTGLAAMAAGAAFGAGAAMVWAKAGMPTRHTAEREKLTRRATKVSFTGKPPEADRVNQISKPWGRRSGRSLTERSRQGRAREFVNQEPHRH